MLTFPLFVGVLVFLSGSIANAALVDRGGGLIYDSNLNITWLQDANYANTSGHDADGRMSWDDANAWAGSLSIYDPVRDVAWDDWRLPSMDVDGSGFDSTPVICDPDKPGPVASELECRDNEYGYMFYQNGVSGSASPGLFTNFSNPYGYWSSTDDTSDLTTPDSSLAWHYSVSSGDLSISDKSWEWYAWAVHDGDIGLSPVPVPAAIWLFGSALVGLGFIGWRKKVA